MLITAMWMGTSLAAGSILAIMGVYVLVLRITGINLIDELQGKRKALPKNGIPTPQEFEDYWIANPDRVTVRFRDGEVRKATVYKDCCPWFDMVAGGGFAAYFHSSDYYQDVWDLSTLLTVKPDRHRYPLTATYLRGVAGRVKQAEANRSALGNLIAHANEQACAKKSALTEALDARDAKDSVSDRYLAIQADGKITTHVDPALANAYKEIDDFIATNKDKIE